MRRTTLIAFLWFASTWLGYEILWSVLEVPRMLGPILAAALSAVVTIRISALRDRTIRLERHASEVRAHS